MVSCCINVNFLALLKSENDWCKLVSEPEKSAREIAEDLLERSGKGLMTGDFAVFADCFALPTEMETFDGRRLIETRAELEAIFNDVRAYFSSTGMTQMERHIVDAEFRNPTSIFSTHQSRVVSDGELVQQPFDVLSVIALIDGQWRIRHSQYAITDSNDHKAALIGVDATQDDRIND